MPEQVIRITTGSPVSGNGVETQEKRGAASATKMAAVSLFSQFALREFKTIMNYSLANYGNFTGDYSTQRDIQVAMSIITDLAGIATATISGGIPGLVVAVSAVAINKVLEVVSLETDRTKERARSAYLIERSGNAAINYSRGTLD